MIKRIESESTCPAILFLVFNRPDTTARVFDSIRAARPSRLYVAADGARMHRVGEDLVAEEVRHISTAVDWPCKLTTLFRKENLGCKRAVSSAIDWFFQHESEGIILEDDCLPSPDFYRYCDILLGKYRYDERIGVICGTNTINLYREINFEDSYYFSRNISVWGWATWRRVWNEYDVDMSSLSQAKNQKIFHRLFSSKTAEYLEDLFGRVVGGKIDTWDYQLSYSLFCGSRLNIIPTKNLIENIGFDDSATHTKSRLALEASNKIQKINFPLSHPKFIVQNTINDDYMNRIYTSKIRRWIQILSKAVS